MNMKTVHLRSGQIFCFLDTSFTRFLDRPDQTAFLLNEPRFSSHLGQVINLDPDFDLHQTIDYCLFPLINIPFRETSARYDQAFVNVILAPDKMPSWLNNDHPAIVMFNRELLGKSSRF